MENLEYELSGIRRNKKRQYEYVIEQPKEPAQERNEDEAISFSVGVIKSLEEKAKKHNSKYPKKVTVLQLKRIFCTALDEQSTKEDVSNTTWALARVNMYARMVSGNIKKINEVLDIEQRVTYNKFVEITANWTPSEEDFKEAAFSVESHNLHYKFKSIDELYLHYQPINYSVD